MTLIVYQTVRKYQVTHSFHIVFASFYEKTSMSYSEGKQVIQNSPFMFLRPHLIIPNYTLMVMVISDMYSIMYWFDTRQ